MLSQKGLVSRPYSIYFDKCPIFIVKNEAGICKALTAKMCNSYLNDI